MGDEFQLGSGNWWVNIRNRSFDSPTTSASISTTLNSLPSYGSPEEAASRLNPSDHMTAVTAGENFHTMGLGLSSPNPDWNQALFSRGEKVEETLRYSLLGDNFQRKRLYSGPSVNLSALPLDQTAPLSSQATSNDCTITCGQYTAAGFRVGMTLSENQQQSYNQNQSSTSYHYSPSSGYGTDYNPFVNKYPQSLRTSQPPPVSTSGVCGSHLHFTDAAPFCNASGAVADAGWGSFFPVGLQTHKIPTPPSIDHEISKDTTEIGDITGRGEKKKVETSNKRGKGNETPSPTPMPPFKVRKEKMGDRITALQQLVSPFGKTDTASVLSEAIAYIKFLHEQVCVLSNPYLKNGAPTQHHHHVQINSERWKEAAEDLRSRGLCLVPVSSTFPMTHETSVDFWTPTYGGTFR